MLNAASTLPQLQGSTTGFLGEDLGAKVWDPIIRVQEPKLQSLNHRGDRGDEFPHPGFGL